MTTFMTLKILLYLAILTFLNMNGLKLIGHHNIWMSFETYDAIQLFTTQISGKNYSLLHYILLRVDFLKTITLLS